MSLYGIQATICGVPCAIVMRGPANGEYMAVFERERASIEDIEAIDWAQPAIEGDCPLPAGYGFTVEDITYSAGRRSYTVTLKTGAQYLGDVTGYQAQVDELTAQAAEQAQTIEVQAGTIQEQAQVILTLEDQLAEADEVLISLYEAQAEEEVEA